MAANAIFHSNRHEIKATIAIRKIIRPDGLAANITPPGAADGRETDAVARLP